VSIDYPSKYPGLRFDRPAAGVLLITIEGHGDLNAYDEAMHEGFGRVWLDVDDDRDTRVVVITGAGEAFQVGSVLKLERTYESAVKGMREASAVVYNMINCDKPIISAINGAANDGGLALALLADISFIAEDAQISDGHIPIGLAAGDHSAILWPLLCGMARAKYYLLTSDVLDGKEAERIGLVSKAVPRDQLMDAALAVAVKLSNGPQHAIRFTKKSINNWLRSFGPHFDASLALEMMGLFSNDFGGTVMLGKDSAAPGQDD